MTFIETLEQTGHYIHFAFKSILAAFTSLTQPNRLLIQLYSVLIGSLPLGVVTGMALGIVVWIHLHGAIPTEHKHKVPEYLTLAVVVEFAPLGAGLIVAGRTGASLGAELGSMRLTEQIEAMEVMGQSPMATIIGPRVMGTILALPVLTIFIAFLSISSSYFAELFGGSLSWTQYKNDCLRSITIQRIIPATLKTTVFGFLVATTGCFVGMNATGGTEGVGKAATQGVVMSILLVMISNVLLVQLIAVVF